MKPFNLEEALAGAPVKFRSGRKGYIVAILPEFMNTKHPVMAVELDVFKLGEMCIYGKHSLTKDGYCFSKKEETYSDVIGMWEEAIDFNPDNVIASDELPCAEPLEYGTTYYHPDVYCGGSRVWKCKWYGDAPEYNRLKSGSVYLTESAARKHLIVMVKLKQVANPNGC